MKCKDSKLFEGGVKDSIIIQIAINKFRWCQISSEIFGSVMSAWHINNSFILAKFITKDDNVKTYPGQIQYFFTHTIDLSDRSIKYYLAYVRWYQHISSPNTRFYFSIDDEEQTCNVELWDIQFYPEMWDCIILIHNILDWFIPVKYKKTSHKNAKEYLTINLINKKFNIH